ncbi:MAG: hypothetical protein HYW89_01455 [Candidatus Sungiibacteriota bacterium]|uniref:Uncharacterized protein n=1 Tax=Candidatus Sungiibacteriota bacterium TaxID=2750080 RepID=A0A7T5UQ84_9BACT|nr:MAG: hypothetical protein HYW89_01455 [Candidatus Sungbacteria bacterium]
MRVLPSFKNKIPLLGPRNLSEDNVIFAWVLILMALSLILVLLDGYIFYRTVFVPQVPEEVTAATQILTKDGLEEVINILDERDKKFNELLKVTNTKK